MQLQIKLVSRPTFRRNRVSHLMRKLSNCPKVEKLGETQKYCLSEERNVSSLFGQLWTVVKFI
jgi:hypothetical protein